MKKYKLFDLFILRTHKYIQSQGMSLKHIGIDSLAAVCQLSCLTACTYTWNTPQLSGQTPSTSCRNYTQD